MTIGELIVRLGIQADQQKVEQFTGALNSTTVKAIGLVAGLVGVSLELRHLLNDAMDVSMALAQFESQTGLSGQELQRWQIMAERSGSSAEAATSSIMALQRAMTEIRLGGGNLKPFQMLGVDINQSPFQALEQIRARIAGMDRGVATNLVSSLGINPEMIRLLTMTNAQFKAMAGDDMIMSEKNRRRFFETREELTRLKESFNYFAMSAIGSFLPFATAMTKAILDWKAALIALGIGLTVVLAQMFPLTAAITGLLLIMQDIYTYKHGGKSVFGEMIDSVPGAKTGLKGAYAANDVGSMQMTNLIKKMYTPTTRLAEGITKITQNHIQIDVHGAHHPEKTGEEVKKRLDKYVTDAADQTNNGGDR